jgi:DNA-binding PadR family transcriptional regulator
MALKHTLLGLLILHPRTGYDLYKRIEGVTFLLEPASLRRIYPTLKQMADDGHVEYVVEPQEGKPDRKVYSVTDDGEAEFLSWLDGPPERDDYTLNSFLGKFFFYGMLDDGRLLARVREALVGRRDELEALRTVEIAPPLGPCREIVDSERVTAVWNLMLDHWRSEVETQIRWLERVIDRVEKGL